MSVFSYWRQSSIWHTHKRTPCSHKAVAHFQHSLLHCQPQGQSNFTVNLRGGRRGEWEDACVQLHPPMTDITGHTCEYGQFSQDLWNCPSWFTYKVIHTTGNKQWNQKCSFDGPIPAARKSYNHSLHLSSSTRAEALTECQCLLNCSSSMPNKQKNN